MLCMLIGLHVALVLARNYGYHVYDYAPRSEEAIASDDGLIPTSNTVLSSSVASAVNVIQVDISTVAIGKDSSGSVDPTVRPVPEDETTMITLPSQHPSQTTSVQTAVHTITASQQSPSDAVSAPSTRNQSSAATGMPSWTTSVFPSSQSAINATSSDIGPSASSVSSPDAHGVAGFLRCISVNPDYCCFAVTYRSRTVPQNQTVTWEAGCWRHNVHKQENQVGFWATVQYSPLEEIITLGIDAGSSKLGIQALTRSGECQRNTDKRYLQQRCGRVCPDWSRKRGEKLHNDSVEISWTNVREIAFDGGKLEPSYQFGQYHGGRPIG